MNILQDNADLGWSSFSNTNLDEDQFRKYTIEVEKLEDSSTQVYESADVASTYSILSLTSATMYQARIKMATKDFGESAYTAPVAFDTVPEKLRGILF